MHGHVGAPVLGSLNGSAQLGFSEGGRIERAMRRRDASTCRQLDLRGPQHELLADADAHLVRTVRNHGGSDLLSARLRGAEDTGHLKRLPEVAVPAGDGDYGARWIDAWAGDGTFVDGALKPERRPA